MVYRNLLADPVAEVKEETEGGGSDEDTGSGVALAEGDSNDESRFEKDRPRGRKFDDKDVKKVSFDGPAFPAWTSTHHHLETQTNREGVEEGKAAGKDAKTHQEEVDFGIK
jgi:RIO kinase 1